MYSGFFSSSLNTYLSFQSITIVFISSFFIFLKSSIKALLIASLFACLIFISSIKKLSTTQIQKNTFGFSQVDK
jgi:hypothetical protein